MNDLLESGAPLNGKGALCTSRATEESRDAYDKSRVQVAAKEGRKAMVFVCIWIESVGLRISSCCAPRYGV